MRIPLLSQKPKVASGNVMANLPDAKPKPVLGKAIGGALLIDLIGSWVGAEYVAQKAGFPTGVVGWIRGGLAAVECRQHLGDICKHTGVFCHGRVWPVQGIQAQERSKV